MPTITRERILLHSPCESGLAVFDAAAPTGTITGCIADILRQHQPLCRLVAWAAHKGLIQRDALAGSDLSRANLTGADLSNANLTDADLSNADLRSANLTGANKGRVG